MNYGGVSVNSIIAYSLTAVIVPPTTGVSEEDMKTVDFTWLRISCELP